MSTSGETGIHGHVGHPISLLLDDFPEPTDTTRGLCVTVTVVVLCTSVIWRSIPILVRLVAIEWDLLTLDLIEDSRGIVTSQLSHASKDVLGVGDEVHASTPLQGSEVTILDAIEVVHDA